ncbi:MAG: hypothetical protein M3146_03420 [Thermoproteota archaeon]|nr:hypothetical protein [Thermoproteota archaeon]
MEKIDENNTQLPVHLLNALEVVTRFPLIQAIAGRRSRRFCVGAEIPEGPLAFKSNQKPIPLTELEQLLLLTSMPGSTGWHYTISYNETVRSKLPSYSAGPAGRTFPSAAGFHTSDLFYTDDNGTYYFSTRDFHPPLEEYRGKREQLENHLAEHRKRIRKLSDKRLYIPKKSPYMDPHNTWIANHKGSTLILPVVDLAQHFLDGIWYYALDGKVVYDDIAKKPIPGVDKFPNVIANPNDVVPLSLLEMLSIAECSAEISMSCYAGALMLQAMGLGGWVFDGMDWMAILGASGDQKVPGFGFRYDTSERWALPNITGLPGVFEAYCPPHYRNMREAVEALAKRKYGRGGVYNEGTPGAWKDSARVRGNAHRASEDFKECVALQAQYIYDTYGKFPATAPSIFAFMYLQAHHLDLSFYDHYFKPGAYLSTHAEHMKNWH